MSSYYSTISERSDPYSVQIIHQHIKKKFVILPKFNQISLKKWLLIFVILTIVSFFFFNELIPTPLRGWIRIPPRVDFYCIQVRHHPSSRISDYKQLMYSTQSNNVNQRLRSDSRILLFVENSYSKLCRQLIEVLESLRFKYKIELFGRALPPLRSQEKGKFSVIIFENMTKFFKMHKHNRQTLEEYCRDFNVGIIGFKIKHTDDNHSRNSSSDSNLKNQKNIIIENLDDNYPLILKSGLKLKDYQLNPSANVLRITRSGTISLGALPGNESEWFVFETTKPDLNSSFIPIAQALPLDFIVETYPGGYRYSSFDHNHSSFTQTLNSSDYYSNYRSHLLTTVLLDNGSFDGIQKILFGNGFDYWLHKLLFIDSLNYLTNGELSLPLKRFVQIDIDDIFVGEKGTRMKWNDVEALVKFQKSLQLLIPGFQFNVGFSGKYFHRGFADENQGDDYMIANANHFRWFCHTYSHSQAHLTDNSTVIENEFLMNQEFAKNHNLPVYSDYIVSPHHSGVYPVHEPLYDGWKKIWKVRVSSTEEYLHLRPAYHRRGFIHKGIMILPRQTCGLYTHTIFIDKYPGGRDKLEKNIFGGDLFYSFILNQVNIFMTHQSNYANDRLAIYSFEAVLKFLQCWTNLQLQSMAPLQMAKKYFEIHPTEKDPIWLNPCQDKRHFNIWSPRKNCSRFPRFLIIGPQKTGSTALYQFLSMHPSLTPNKPNNQTFEEIQFFNGLNYLKGIDWYMSFFPLVDDDGSSNGRGNVTATASSTAIIPGNSSHTPKNFFARIPPVYPEESLRFFEKSSTYFDGDLVPMRVHSLLPHAKLVIILINPKRRAYSWYQHMKAHNLSVALNHSFYEVISLDLKDKQSMNPITMKKLRDFRNRCLLPGLYAVHIDRWLSYFPAQQLHIVDGVRLRYYPTVVMDKLQTFLKLEPHLNYGEMLRYDPKKGFYCQLLKNDSVKCLGKSKGRNYPPMDTLSEKYLTRYYWHHNLSLMKMLKKFHWRIPSWLESELNNHHDQ